MPAALFRIISRADHSGTHIDKTTPAAILRRQLLRRNIHPRLFDKLTVIMCCFVLFRWFKLVFNSNFIPTWAGHKRKYCHKIVFSGLTSVCTAVHSTSLTFNKGMCSLAPLFEKLSDVDTGPYTWRYLIKLDQRRVKQSMAHATTEPKRRRQVRCDAEKLRKEQLLEKEEVTYQSGNFCSLGFFSIFLVSVS